MSVTFTLINARPSPYGRKVAIALIEKGLPYRVEYDVPWGGETCTPQHSPLQQLPILLTMSGEKVYDSTYILEWLERTYPDSPLLPADVAGALHQKLVQMLAERLMEIAQTLIFELQRPAPSNAWIDRQSRKIAGGLEALDGQIGSRRVGDDDQVMLGDIAIGSTLLCIEFVVSAGYSQDLDVFRWRSRHPNLREYVEILETRPSFRATRPEKMEVDIAATMQ